MIKLLFGLLFATLFVANAFAFECPNGEIPPGFLVETCSNQNSQGCVRGQSNGLLIAWEHAEGNGPILKWANIAHKCDYDFSLLGVYEVDENGVLISDSLVDFDELDWKICKPSSNGHLLAVDIFGELEDESESSSEEASENGNEDEPDNDADLDVLIQIDVVKSPHSYFFDVSFELDNYQFCHDMAEDLVWAALFSCEDDNPGHSNGHDLDDCPLNIDLIVCNQLANYTYIPPGGSNEVSVNVQVSFSDEDNGRAGFFLIFDTGSYPGRFVSLQFDARFEVPHP
jgi:hypothetical protein